MPLLDEPGPVRAGEAIDADALRAFLRAQGLDAPGPIVIRQFPRGYSNLTYLVRLGDREWVLRRPPVGNRVKSAHDMGREARILARLAPVYPLAPRPVASCEDESILGAPFFLMERRRGIILRGGGPYEGFTLGPEDVRRLGEALIDHLADLHRLDLAAAGLADLGHPEGYVARQVAGWSRRWEDARTDPLPEMDRLAAWLVEHRPPEAGAALVHNDFKFDNLVLDPADPSRVVAVLDWEMATLGDPLLDLGTTLGYWVEPTDPPDALSLVVGPTTLPGAPSRHALLDRYIARTGRPLAGSDALFAYAFGLFKIAVIAQQIYARFARGLTRDPRFASLPPAIASLARRAGSAIDTGKI